jgi:TRAP-type C4-dicarboxylate transport system permease small subunit
MIARLHAALAPAIARLDKLIELVTSTLLVVIVAINAAEIVTRSFFAYSFDWIHEINLLLANWLYFLGICLVYFRNQDITVDFVLKLFPGRRRVLYLIAVNLAIVATLIVLAVYAWELVELQTGFKTMGLGIRNHWFSLPVLIGTFVLLAIVATQSLRLWLERERDSA